MIWLLLVAVISRPYFPVTVSDLAAGRNFHTHVAVTGAVTYVKREADGDTHIRLGNGKVFVVAECILALPCKAPKVGQKITVRGISRFDLEHKWYEVHPVESLK